MRSLGWSAAVAFAIANLYLLFLTGPLVSPERQLIFHLPGSAVALFAPVILDLLAATAVLTALLHWARRHRRAELVLYALLLLPLPWTMVLTVASFAGQPAALWLRSLTAGLALACIAVVLLRSRSLERPFGRVRRGLRTLLSFVALSGFVILGQLFWLGWKARDLNPPFVAHAATHAVPPGAPRVVWIIFDELSYRQLYGHRFTGLALPNFDRLASQATVFTTAFAAAQYTRVAVPSLLTGEALTATVPTSDGRHILLHTRGHSGWHALDPQQTVFGDAAAAGLPTGIAGWYEPYCRVLPGVLDQCFWTYSDNIPGDLSAYGSVAANALRPPLDGLLRVAQTVGIGAGRPSADARDVEQHAADYRALYAAGDCLLTGQNAGLILLHMPIPHPWGFYDRRAHTFPGHRTSYLDNLALADAYLGHVRALLEQHGSWDATDLVIMGDHGWRTASVWRNSGFWTSEENVASQGTAAVDPPAVLVKLHGQQQSLNDAHPFDTVRTRALINALLARKITTPQQLQQWIAQ